ncbi:hypothetical protein DICVIV_11746 [Dictyocaulus viviparus]|uniref:Uncharacterized protein n=1 Tax=Dictyocaulus viviparus TaxID=29172 RepID=A0A0D8XCF4_DICVI|nr:hypothetical protein DICVIV_11746 [Dictyocaulus viviparus]
MYKLSICQASLSNIHNDDKAYYPTYSLRSNQVITDATQSIRAMIPLWGIIAISTFTTASFCGRSGVPFSVEVLPSGAPVLGCAQPSCIYQSADDFDESVFNTDQTGQADGFFREGDRPPQGYLQANKLTANCSGDFDQLSCSRKNQWVGGIEYIDHPRQPLLLQCCTFEGLRFSQIVGVTPIGPGEAVTGGEVIRDGRQISFDVIANIRKVVDRNDSKMSVKMSMSYRLESQRKIGLVKRMKKKQTRPHRGMSLLSYRIYYEVAVRRMNCLPDPPEIEIAVDDDVEEELLRVLEKANDGSELLGHDEHLHVESEKLSCDRSHGKKCRNKKKNNKIDIQPRSDRAESFGAPIFNPTSMNHSRIHHSRRIVTTLSTNTPVLPTEPTSTVKPNSPFFFVPTLAPFTFPTLPTIPQMLMIPSYTPRPTEFKPFQFSLQPHAFGVPQTFLTPLLPPPTYQHLHPFAQPQLIQQQFEPFISRQPTETRKEETVNSTQKQHRQTIPQQPHNGMPISGSEYTSSPFHNHFALAMQNQQQLPFPSMPEMFKPFMQPNNLQTTPPSKPTKKLKSVSDDDFELVEPSAPPTQKQLAPLFQPPPFTALNSALQNFQLQG